ncbi:phage major capsid protein [Ramlibacter sp. MAHUQ-53]|uniref:phage major capsid protein n=1 Tax=unclassified Ramlibacter TaxID=2617605 RepID=UPI003632E781
MTIEVIMKSLEKVEANLTAMSEKADGELKTLGKVTSDTKTALDNIGTAQRELADRLTSLEQKGALRPEGEAKADGWGDQLVKSAGFEAFARGEQQKVRIEVKNTLTGSDANVAPDRRPGVVPGAAPRLTIESLYASIPTTSNAIEFTKEASFTNNAAEAAEGAAKAESALTWSLVNQPVSTVAHWIKISRQLAMDNAALAAYVDARMRYGVQRKVETQLVSGDGSAPNIAGFMKAGNYTAHGYLSGALGSVLAKLVLIRKAIGDLEVAGYEPDGIVLNPADWATIETELLTASSANAVRVDYSVPGMPLLFGVPVVKSVGMTADTFAVGSFRQHGNIYNREGVVVQMSESDSDNFTKNLITLRAERRLALTSEVPAAIRGGDLTPPAA